jgi:hypothetical protein
LGGLGGPRAGRVGGDTGKEHFAGVHLDEEQDVVATQECCVDGEEVARDRCLGVQDSVQVTSDRMGAGSMSLSRRICHTVVCAILWPRPTSSPWTRRYPHVGFSVARRTISRLAVPAQQRLGCHDPVFAQPTGECCGDRAEHRSVVVGEGRPANLAAEYLNLVAQHDDLQVLRASGADGESSECGQEAVRGYETRLARMAVSGLVSTHVGVSEPHRVDSVLFEDSPDSRSPDLVTETGEPAVDAAISPGRVVVAMSMMSRRTSAAVDGRDRLWRLWGSQTLPRLVGQHFALVVEPDAGGPS